VRRVLGVAPVGAGALVGLPDRARAPGVSVLVVFCLVRGSALRGGIGSLAVVDPDYLTYRLSDQDVLAGLDPEWHRVVVEAGPGVVARAQAGEDVAAVLVTELGSLLTVGAADVRVLRTLAAPNAVTVPTAESVPVDASARAELAAAAPAAVLTGALLGTAATSMNDQIVQGLAAADALR
jgi:hypothetical protein